MQLKHFGPMYYEVIDSIASGKVVTGERGGMTAQVISLPRGSNSDIPRNWVFVGIVR